MPVWATYTSEIEQIDNATGDVVRTWPTAKAASDALGVGRAEISKALKGANKTAGGYSWCYVVSRTGTVYTGDAEERGGRGEAGSLVCRLVATPARAEGGKLKFLWGGRSDRESRESERGPAGPLLSSFGSPLGSIGLPKHIADISDGELAASSQRYTSYAQVTKNSTGYRQLEVSGSRQVSSSNPSHSEYPPRSTRTTRTRCLRSHARRRRHRSCRVPTSRSLLRWQRRRTLCRR